MNKQVQTFLRLFGSSVLRIVIYSCFGAIFGAMVTLFGGACVFFAFPGMFLSGLIAPPNERSQPSIVIGLPQVGSPIYWVIANVFFYGALGIVAGLIDLPIRMT